MAKGAKDATSPCWPNATFSTGRPSVLPVPLLPPDEDVPLDLQRAVNACYDLVRYERLLDYTAAPPPGRKA
ncbi:MAG: DUF4058 family protein, partial [Candidatus Promineofilum sp.]|nr:DUF4058 family protein [Promineifilum sp.]